jgi:hypothetical protein
MLYQLGSSKNIFKVDGYHDPDSVRPFTITLKPPAWSAATVYQTGDIVVPTTYKGLAYECVNPGKSHAATEPDWALTLDEITNDFEAGETAGLTWKAIAYAYLPRDEDASTAVVTCTADATVSDDTVSASAVNFTIDAIASDADARTDGKFRVKSHIVTSTGREFDVTLEFTLAEG